MDSRFSAANSFIRLTRSVSFASVDSISLPLLVPTHRLLTRFDRELRSPTAAGATPAAAAAAKTSKSSAATRTAAESPASAEHATDHGADPPAAAAASSSTTGRAVSESPDDANDDENKDQDRPDGDRRGIVSGPLNRTSGRGAGKRHAAIVGDVFGELPGRGFDAGAVISLEKVGAHQAACVAGAGVVDDGLETIADFGPILAFR